MADDVSGGSDGGPPSFPGGGGPAPAPPAPPAPPSYPDASSISFPPPPTSFDTPTGVPYASWGIRLGGYLIDIVIFAVVLIVLYIPLRHAHTLVLHTMARRGQRRHNISGVPFLITAVLYIAYSTFLCGGRKGQTIGMMAVGVKAVRDGTLSGLGYGRAFGRALLEQVLRLVTGVIFIVGIIWLLDMLFPLWDKKRQTLHDKATGTVVIRSRAAG